ncbi:g3114 [Coccomyxa elongata]
MGEPPLEYGAPRQDWNIEDIEWDPTEVRAELRTARSVDPDASASSAAQAVASSSGPTNESGGDVPVVLDTFQSAGSTKRRVPMQCQVDGCNKDLSVEKEYYQRYRICEEHLKLSSLLKDGVQQRFCQQCGRFHLLAEFDGDKRSCRARLDLHNNRRRKRGEAGDGSFRSSARLERRLGDTLHSHVSPRTRARRTATRSRRSPALSTTDDEMTEDNSEVEQATRSRSRPRQSVAAAAVEEEAGTPTTRERRYATRQATAAAQRKPHSYNPALDFEKLYPPSIAETLAALQRGAGPAEPPPLPAPSHMSLREELAIGQSSLDASTRQALTAGGRQRLVAEQMLRHLSDPGQVTREHLRQHSGTGLNIARNMLLVNSLSSPTYLPSSMDRMRSEGSAGQASLEQEFHESLRAHSSELYQQQGAAPQLPYGGPFSDALGAAGLSHYAAQLLYKCASDPIVQDTFGRPNLPPAAIAGVHLAPGAAGAGGSAGSAAGGGGPQGIISYSSEPTSGSTSGLAKFSTEPYIRPRSSVYPQYSAFDLPPGEFHDVAWPGPPQAPSAEPKQEQLSFRQGPTKRFFESAEGSSQGSRGKGRASQQQQQMGSMETAGAPGQAPGRTQAFTLPGLPAGLSFSMSPLAGLAHSSGGGASGSGGGLSRLPSAEEVQASMQREHSTERHMGRISLASSLDILQQRMTSDRQALLAGERSASGGDQPRRSTDGGPQPGGALMRTSSQRLPSGFMERIPEHAATIEAPLTAQDLLPAARPGSALLSDFYTAYNFQSARSGAGFAASAGHREPAAEGGSQYAGFQGLRDASLQPWHQVASPSQAGLASLVGTPGPPARGGNGGQPEGSAWAASLFASPSSTAMSSTPSKDGTSPSSWLSPLLQQVAGGSASAPARTSSEAAATGPMDTAQLLSTWRADSGASFSTLPLPRASIAAAPARSEPAEAERERTPPPSEPGSAERPAAPLAAPLGAAEDACSPCSSPAGAGAQHVRVSTKLESAGAEDIAGRALRSDLEGVLGGEGNVPRLEAAVRPGCVHLVVDALVLQTSQADDLDAIRRTAMALAAGDPLWRRGRVLLQTANAAALLQDGVVCRVWIGEDLKRQVPEMPCAAPFAAAVPGSLALRLHRSFFHCPRAGLRCATPRRLLARCRGRFLADVDLTAMQAVHTKDVRVELGAAGGPGLAWLEAECDGFMSAPLPVVLSPNPDIVEEIRVLEPDVAAGRRPWEATSALLADVGLILEYAAVLGGGDQPGRNAALALQDSMCMQHVARLAQRRLPDFCELGWPALTAQALPLAAVGCTSLRQLLLEEAVLAEGAGTLLHAAVRSESISMVSLLLDLGRYGFKWDLRAQAEPGAQTALHLAANMDDEGRMAGLLLRHPSCPEAGMLWSILKNAAGQTPADIAFSAGKARPGRIFLLLSPAERASIGSCYSAPEHSCSSVDGDDELTPESSITPSTESALSRQASSSAEEVFFRRGVVAVPQADSLPATPFLDVSLPFPPPRQQKQDAGAGSAPEEQPQMRSVESAPLASCELSSMASCILRDDRIIRKSLSADSDSHASREQLRAALLPQLARAVQAMRSAAPAGPAEPPRQSLDGVRAALRIGSESDSDLSPSMEDLRRLRRAIAAFPDAPAASAAADGRPSEMQRLSVVMHDMGAVRCASASVVRQHPEESSVADLPISLSAPSVIPAGCSQGLLPGPMDELSANKTRGEGPATHQPPGSTSRAHPAAAAMPLDYSLPADRPGRPGERRAETVRARQVALVLLMLASCLVLPRAAFLCMLASLTVFLLCSPSFQEVWASFPSCAGQDVCIDKLEAQVTYSGWRRHLLGFTTADLERDFLHFFAGARYQLDVLFSVLFTVFSLLLLCSGAPHLPSPAAGPWLGHALFAALPAALALKKRSWYLRHREVVMMVARIGCQLAAIFCSATSQGGSAAPSHWTTALIGEVLAAALQLLHLPIGFQIRTFLHLPLTLLALRLRLRVRPQPSWPQAAAVAALTLLPTRLVAVLERRARRCFLASLSCRPVSAGVPPRRGA